tara:strand:- start:702 stop:2282 length:1581 start_codon:yes stop_codon:yes gene_type:complete
MALKFSESPAVRIREIDLSGIVPAVTSTTGAFVGDFNWGPVNTPVLVGNESELASTFGSPLAGSANASDFISASYFLKYSSSLYVVRSANGDHAKSKFPSTGAIVVEAKYEGELGNDLTVSVCRPSDWSEWLYQDLFSSAPVGDEVHVVVSLGYVPPVLDSDNSVVVEAELGTILETYEYLSTVEGDQKEDGSNNYVFDVVNGRSSWVELKSLPLPADLYAMFVGGAQGTIQADEYSESYDKFDDKDKIQIDFLIAPSGGQFAAEKVHKKLVEIASDRKDCVAVISPRLKSTEELNVSTVQSYVEELNENSSYLVFDGGWLKVYDKYNDKYINIPACSSTAGIMAATDLAAAAWFSPAGSRRGQYIGVTDLVFNPSKSDRDVMYKSGVNPIVSFPGQGIMLYGDKTHLSRPSAFDRINVRRLFLVIERAISEAAENVMFEFNDEFTRAEFVNIVEPFLREIQGRRGITDFRLVCDTTNNTPEVIDRNEFVASCFIKPARSINYVTLNFVAVRSGASFEEVVGTSGV